MRITIICSKRDHPIFPRLEKWMKKKIRHGESVSLVYKVEDITYGDLLFLISCHDIITKEIRAKFQKSLVIHASDVPRGRGWSPHVWQIVEGSSRLKVTLLEAEDAVDTGLIWAQRDLKLEGHELYDEINDKLFSIELKLMDFAVKNFNIVEPKLQPDSQASYYRKRIPEDSRIDPYRPIAEQFNLLRVADSSRYPAFFELHGYRYQIKISKIKKMD